MTLTFHLFKNESINRVMIGIYDLNPRLNATKQNVLNWSLHVFVFMSSLIKLLLTRQQFVKSLHKCVCAKNESYLHTTVYAFIDRCTKNIFSLKMHFYDYFSTLLYTQYMVFKIRFSG